jgi:transcriptional regulator with XRE-family HTH domain
METKSQIATGPVRTRGRPPKPLDRDASGAAYLGADLRSRRQERDLTQQALADLVGYTPQHISEVERAKTWPTPSFIATCDQTLEAQGRLLALLPAVNDERDRQRQERAAARKAQSSALRSGAASQCEAAGDDDVEPTDRRGLLGAGAAVALGLSAMAAPVAARDVDPELPAHWDGLLSVLGHHDDANGPVTVLDAVRHELRVIAMHRAAARGDLRRAVIRVEARWTVFAAWLANDTGDVRAREALLDRALRLANESGYADVAALARARRAQWSDAPRALRHAEAGEAHRAHPRRPGHGVRHGSHTRTRALGTRRRLSAPWKRLRRSYYWRASLRRGRGRCISSSGT